MRAESEKRQVVGEELVPVLPPPAPLQRIMPEWRNRSIYAEFPETWGKESMMGIQAFEEDEVCSPFEFRQRTTLSKRRRMFQRIAESYTDRVPVIVRMGKGAMTLLKTQYLCPADMTAGAFIAEIRRHMSRTTPISAATTSLFLFTENSRAPPCTMSMERLWTVHRNKDDYFLYLVVMEENTFG